MRHFAAIGSLVLWTSAFGLTASGCAAERGADDEAQDQALAQEANEGPYPIVLAHGFFGFDSFAGVESVTYFYGVKDYLREQGEREVYTPAVDPFNASDVRAARLIEHIERIRRETGAAKVNLIGHSQGGLDARLVAHDRPDLVASVTTFSTPHHGTPIADALTPSFPGSSVVARIVDTFVRITLRPLWSEIGSATSFMTQLRFMSSEGTERFNAEHPDQPGIPYFSIAGRSGSSLGEGECASDAEPDFVARWKDARDPLEPLLRPTKFLLDGDGDGAPFVHDGIVRVRDAKWGTFLGCVPADHFDEVGHLFESADPDGVRWNHKEFYADVVKYLRARGL